MPGHFTHIYTARRVAALLAGGEPGDWPDLGAGGPAVQGLDSRSCGQIMQNWEKFTAIGAIGPDLFFFSQDWNNPALEPHSDDIMLALAVYFFYDAAKDDHWEPLVDILEDVDSTLASLIRLVILLQSVWDDFKKGWDATIGPLVDVVGELTDDITGGILGELKDVLTQFLNDLETVGAQEISQYARIWDRMNTVVARGFEEKSFLWSDMTHYRRTTAVCQALVHQAELQRDGTNEGQERYEQFLAFAMGWITHVGTDTIAHSFVNEQCGGPYRTHPTRHHLIENHIDAWNYSQTGVGGTLEPDPWGKTDDYPELSSSALVFAVQLTPDHPRGKQRPSPLPDDPQERKAALDVDGEMPMWMANAIVAALLETFTDHPHPLIYQGDAYQAQIDQGKLTQKVRDVTGHGLDRPFQELLDLIAPPPPFPVPQGFPLPWEVATSYRLMTVVYRLFFNGGWQLPKPRKPDAIIFPPQSDFTNLFQPPDFSGVNSTNPVVDACEVFIALIQWLVKEAAAVIKLLGDIVKMIVSGLPFDYEIRKGLYEAAMKLWDIATKTHDVLAHTGLLMPHAEARYPDNGELMWPNEIDLPLVTLGSTVDGAFLQALADAVDIFGNVDQDESLIVSHSVRDRRLPFYPALRYHADNSATHHHPPDPQEFRHPWAFPDTAEEEQGGVVARRTNVTETYDPSRSGPDAPDHVEHGAPPGPYAPMRPGPYPEGTTPDDVFFRTQAPIDADARSRYERARSPWETDQLNEEFIARAEGEQRVSPLGDPVPFSAYLIGQLVNPTGYATQFNLDADRAYAYLTWDWNRWNDDAPEHQGHTPYGATYRLPLVPPWDDEDRWLDPKAPMQLHYVDPVPPVIILNRDEQASDAAPGGEDGRE